MRPDNDPANLRKAGPAVSKCRAAPGAWCLTALQPLFLRRGALRPPPQSTGRPAGRGAPLPASPYFFVLRHHVLHSKVPGSPGDVVPHCPPALVSSSSGTTSSAPKCRAAPETWCLTALQPLFLRRGAPRHPLQSAGRPVGRGAPLPASPCFFVEEHHVIRHKVPTGLRDVVPHCPPALVSSSSGTTSSAPKCRAAPETWCLTALQPLFLRRGAPRQATQTRQPASHAAGYCKISIFLDKCVLKGNFFYGIISIRRYSI